MPKLNRKRIKELRESCMSKNSGYMYISNLAKAIDVPHLMLTRMEHDEDYNPGVFTLLKVSEFYNVTIDDLIIKD